ncbi:MAG: hypothetical protein Q9202_000491 [Teloschistes flavicans]
MSLKRKRKTYAESTKENEQPAVNGIEDHPNAATASLTIDDAPETPSKRRRGRPPGSTNKPKSTPEASPLHETPRSRQSTKRLFETPSKQPLTSTNQNGIPTHRNADRSARRKSARALVERTITADIQADLGEEDDLAMRILDADEEEEEDEEDDDDDENIGDSSDEEPVADAAPPETPSKRGKKGPRRKRTPTPPHDLPPHEQYFFQNRPGNNKTSNNTLSSISLLSHEQYHNCINAYKDPHSSSYAYLHSLHSRSFPQWRFELSQAFSICLYGYGSKRNLTASFAKYLHSHHPHTPSSTPPKIIITNGYTPALTIRHILNTVATAIYDCPASALPKLGNQPREMLDTILAQLTTSPPPEPIHLLINSLDAQPLRRAPVPALLAQLSSHPKISLLATCDTPNFPLLWDTNLRDQYNWLFHDCTTFISYGEAEIEDAVEEVNQLLGRSGRRIKGREGVGFVLRSVPENARALYRILIAELLAQEGEGLGLDDQVHERDGEDDEFALIGTPAKSGKGAGVGGGGGEPCIEYRTLYQKVVEEFICSSEMGFRQLLKEFHDHQMIVSRRDATGAEMLGVPFRREEIEAILEDLMA